METFVQWLLVIISTTMICLYVDRVFKDEYPVVKPVHRYHDVITSVYLIIIVIYISSQ